MTFRIGQKVVCIGIDDWLPPHRVEGVAVPQIDGIYTIRNFVTAHTGDTCLRFDELRNAEYPFIEGMTEPGFRTKWFRPLIERKSSTEAGFSILDDIRKRETLDEPVKPKTNAREQARHQPLDWPPR